jgi:hypothetical protein
MDISETGMTVPQPIPRPYRYFAANLTSEICFDVRYWGNNHIIINKLSETWSVNLFYGVYGLLRDWPQHWLAVT